MRSSEREETNELASFTTIAGLQATSLAKSQGRRRDHPALAPVCVWHLPAWMAGRSPHARRSGPPRRSARDGPSLPFYTLLYLLLPPPAHQYPTSEAALPPTSGGRIIGEAPGHGARLVSLQRGRSFPLVFRVSLETCRRRSSTMLSSLRQAKSSLSQLARSLSTSSIVRNELATSKDSAFLRFGNPVPESQVGMNQWLNRLPETQVRGRWTVGR